MKITSNQLFLHGYDRYEAGEEYDVPEGLGTYFVMSGWADSDEVEVPGQPQPSETTLEVHDSAHESSSEVK